jgi:hypothetical protein
MWKIDWLAVAIVVFGMLPVVLLTILLFWR